VTVGALGTAVGVVLSPLGLLTAGLVAGGLAWVAFSERGGASVVNLASNVKTSFGDMILGWEGVKQALKEGNLDGALKMTFASIGLEWAKLTSDMSQKWIEFGRLMKDVFAVGVGGAEKGLKGAQNDTADWLNDLGTWLNRQELELERFIELKRARFGSADGVQAAGKKTEAQVNAEFDKKIKAMEEEAKGIAGALADDRKTSQAAVDDHLTKLAQKNRDEAEAKMAPYKNALENARAEFNKARDGVTVGQNGPMVAFAGGAAAFAELKKAQDGLSGIGISGSSRGAFNFGNAAQFFGGGNSIAGQQLKQQEIANAKLDAIRAAIGNVPLAVIK
jgi:hypothetical protein